MLQLADGELDHISQGQGMQLQGDFSIAGLFALHYTERSGGSLPALDPCNEWVYTSSSTDQIHLSAKI